ncbi:MAG TPA: TonB-dependent receptor [Gemmatimonadaceae bacterium]|nr:TonB-dependent receptor [Gemmatimonadaceae bacterium]
MKPAALLLVALLSWFPAVAGCQTTSPLEKRVTVHVRDTALRDALDRVAAIAAIRISYSAENIPLDRRVSVSHDSATVDQILDEMLRDLPVQPVAVAADLVVLTPRPASAPDTLVRPAAVLDRIVVTGSVLGASERPLPVALDIVRGRDAERRDETALSKVLDGSVPGVWVWEQAPATIMARYGSIRGASSFGLSYPKVYVDGIEVANPLLFTQITPELVDRVEVIRGPQGAALYGSDAISGVVNVVSRHDGTGADGTHALLRTQAGYAMSAYAPGSVPMQEHALTFRGGSNLNSGGVTVGVSTAGGYIPQAYSRELQTLGDARIVGAHHTFTATARFQAKNAGVAPNPLLVRLNPEQFDADSAPQLLRMYAAGATLTVMPAERWTYTMTGGVDGYSLSNISNDLTPIPSAADTALRDASGSATRVSMRASGVTYVGDPATAGATVTLAIENSLLRDRTAASIQPTSGNQPGDNNAGGPAQWVVGWGTNTGVSAQVSAAFHESVYLTAGLRGEHLNDTRGISQDAALPMLGASFVRDAGPFTVKLRAAYGKGIRAPHTGANVVTHEWRHSIANANLEPEKQAGTEAGVDVLLGRLLGVHVTRFDQLASGLIQTTVMFLDSTNSGGPGRHAEYGYQLQNVGEITNRGWEAQASLSVRQLSITGAGSLVNSVVRQLAVGYTGDLRPGDRMLAVPKRTASLTAAWTSGTRLQASTTVARAWDWINYDRLGIAQALIAAGGDPANLTGDKLRQFWARYPGASRLRASIAYDVWHGTLLTLNGENLLNYQRGEPDSITIVPGRTLMLGLKARF